MLQIIDKEFFTTQNFLLFKSHGSFLFLFKFVTLNLVIWYSTSLANFHQSFSIIPYLVAFHKFTASYVCQFYTTSLSYNLPSLKSSIH